MTKTRATYSVATCMIGSSKHQRKFTGRVGDGVVIEWLRKIDGYDACVHEIPGSNEGRMVRNPDSQFEREARRMGHR